VTTTTHVDGSVAPGFEEVRTEFERNFAERGEIGAAVAVYWRGEKVVDLWGGRRTCEGDAPWNQNTMVVVQDGFWGGRIYRALDHEGHQWEISQRGRDLAAERWRLPPGVTRGVPK
jgi:hypothetical protein